MTKTILTLILGLGILISGCQSSDPCKEKVTSENLGEILMTKASDRKISILQSCFKLDNTIRTNVKPAEEYYGRLPMNKGYYNEMIAFSTDDEFDTIVHARGSDFLLYSTTDREIYDKLNDEIKDNYKEIYGGSVNGHATKTYYNPNKITAYGLYKERTHDGDTIYNIRLQKIIAEQSKILYAENNVKDGFLTGLLHGVTFPFRLFGKLIGSDMKVYSVNNTGVFYWIGFAIGCLILLAVMRLFKK